MTKDQVRARVWGALESSGAAVGSPWSAIPNYKGADDAARILAGLPEFREAKVVKSNPDPAQGPFRLAALRAGKKLYTPVPELVQDTPFVLLDPEVLEPAASPSRRWKTRADSCSTDCASNFATSSPSTFSSSAASR